MMYLQDTQALSLIVSLDNSDNIQWYIDALYVVYKDTKSHTGVLMTMGKSDVVFWKSCKQKLTESFQ